MTTNTSPHLAPPPSSLGHMNNDRVGDEIVPTSGPPIHKSPPSPRSQSKSILTVALQKAQTAVQFDAANNVVAALEAYKQTVELLSQVIVKAANEADRRRLQLIHDTYADRIRLLSTIAPESDGTSSNDTSGTDLDPDLSECENNDKSSTSEQSPKQNDITESSTNTETRDVRKAESSVQGSTNASDNDSIDVNSNQLSKDRSLNFNRDPPIQQSNDDIEQIKETKSVEPMIVNGVNTTSVIEHSNTKDNLKTERDHVVSTQSKRLSIISHKSNNSASIDKPDINKTAPASVYDGTKPVADTSDVVEFSVGSEDLASNISSVENSDTGLQEKAKQVSSANQDISREKSSSSSSSSSQIELEAPPPENTTERRTPPRVFVPPPPPKIAPPPNNSSHLRSDGVPTPDQPFLERRSTSPSIVSPAINKSPTLTSETATDSLLKPTSEEDDDKASIRSAPPESIRTVSHHHSSSTSGRRPTPLSLDPPEIYNSRNLSRLSPSNYNLVGTVQPSHSPGFPRRAASNPGSGSRKSSVRLFNQSQSTSSPSFAQSLSQIPGTPTSPHSGVPPPLGSPGFGTFRSDQSISSSKTAQSGYMSCLMNPLLHDEDFDLPTIKSSTLPEPPPGDVHLRPFWLMRLLERTMTTGGYLTQKLYIPRNLWLQSHAKLIAIDAKISSCEVVLGCLVRLSKTSVDDMSGLWKELEGIEPILEGLQNSLARKLSYVESTSGKGRQSTSSLMNWGSKLSRSLDRMGMSNVMVRSEEANGYVDVLIKVFQSADVVEKYILYFSSLKPPHHHHYAPIVTRLFKVADYFSNVLCLFVIRDLGIMADKYVKKGSHWIAE